MPRSRTADRRPTRAAVAPPAAWDVQPGETTKAFGCFVSYRDLGWRRSLSDARSALAADGVSVSVQHLRKLSADWDWMERARAFDAWEDQEKIRVRLEAMLAADAAARALAVRGLAVRDGILDTAERVTALLNAKLDRLGPEGVPLPDVLRMVQIVATVAPSLVSPDADPLDGLDADALEALRQIAEAVAAVPEHETPHETPDAETPAA